MIFLFAHKTAPWFFLMISHNYSTVLRSSPCFQASAPSRDLVAQAWERQVLFGSVSRFERKGKEGLE